MNSLVITLFVSPIAHHILVMVGATLIVNSVFSTIHEIINAIVKRINSNLYIEFILMLIGILLILL